VTKIISLPQYDPAPVRPAHAMGPRSLDAVRMLRVSVTDRCHLRCRYCMPAEGVSFLPHGELLHPREIERVVQVAIELGVTHVKLTGGEPTLRRDLLDIIARLRGLGGIELSMTTNGLRLESIAADLREAGLDRLTVSIDSLRPDRYTEITGGGRLSRLWRGLDAADAIFGGLKLNTVVMRGVNDDEVGDFARLAIQRDWTVRFIEFMPLGRSVLSEADPSAILVTAEEIEAAVVEAVGSLGPRHSKEPGIGPARVHATSTGRGRIGFIHAMSQPFCASCNRLRLDATGMLRSCLFDGGEVDLRGVLRADPPTDMDTWRHAFAGCTAMKPETHGVRGNRAMSSIGG
jgi:cyclic pyranopterin phosphate synthase